MESFGHPTVSHDETDRRLIIGKFDLPRENVEEDAPPLVAGDPVRLIGVFDGLGGAGSRKVDGDHGQRSSAFYASRIAREAVRSAVEDGHIPTAADGTSAAQILSQLIGDALAKRNAVFPVASTVVRSSIMRSYPTTAAIILFDRHLDRIEATALWAGDSRCYALSPSEGLQQLTRDDSRSKSDPMAALREDGPMSNMLTADAPCRVHAVSHKFDQPVILLTATDGSYGCLPSPMHFEFMLLQTIAQAKDDVDWVEALHQGFKPIANDDISIVAAFIGWTSLSDVSSAFAGRLEHWRPVFNEYDHLRKLAADLDVQARQFREEAKTSLERLWERYQAGYMARLGVRP